MWYPVRHPTSVDDTVTTDKLLAPHAQRAKNPLTLEIARKCLKWHEKDGKTGDTASLQDTF